MLNRTATLRRRRGLLIGAAAIAACAAATAAAITALASVERPSTRMPASSAQLFQTPEQLIAAILRGIPHTNVSRAEVGLAPASFGQPAGTNWIDFQIRSSSSPAYVRGYWEATLVSGLVRDVGASKGWSIPAGQSFTRVLPDGRKRFDSAGLVVRPFEGDIDAASLAEIDTTVRDGAQQIGADVVSIAYLRPLGHLAPIIVLRVRRPVNFVRHEDQLVWDVVDALDRGAGKPRVEGTLVDVLDTRGRLISVSGFAVRTASGVGWSNPRFERRG